jgi:outer membrane protein assembly factor BamD (BamD/ComL family)
MTAHAAAPVILDVWSRTAPRYRRRAVFMLFLLSVLFAALCCFTFWLRTGAFAPWMSDRYWDLLRRSFNPSGADQVTLSDFLSFPVNVRAVPIQAVILGLLFATLSSIPILVCILYRFPFAIIFAAMVACLAAMPWLGLTALGGCALASLPPLRFSFRYASALLGLVPIGIYFIMASWEPAGARSPSFEHQALLYAPWVLALLGSCVICAVGLAIARLINYRPGGISPVLATLFIIPVVLFHTQVGRDELEYRILEKDIGPGSSTLFVPRDVGAEADRDATRRWSASHDEPYDAIRRHSLDRALRDAALRAENDRLVAVEQCDSFIIRFPGSRYVGNVYYLKGRAQDQRIQHARLFNRHRLEFRSDWPSLSSRQTWKTIEEQFPASAPAAVALHRLALLEARDGRIDAACDLLQRIIDRFDGAAATSRPAGIMADRASLFQRADPAESLGLDLPALIIQARHLREMLAACRDDAPVRADDVFLLPAAALPAAPLHPAGLLLSMDDSHRGYGENLLRLIEHFPGSHAADYADLRRIQLEPAISRRIALWRGAATRLAGRPAAAEALFQLGDVFQEDSLSEEARAAFNELINLYPQSCWAAEAKDRLASLPFRQPGAVE